MIADRRKNVYGYFEAQETLLNEKLTSTIENYRKGTAKINITDKDGSPVRNAHISVRQKSHDFKFGANIFMLDQLECESKNNIYRDIFPELFNLATVPFYWCDLERECGKPRFDKNSPYIYRRPAPDLCVEYCSQNGITPKAHCLNYDQWSPLWLPDNAAEVRYFLEKRIAECAERYRSVIPVWEVTNEFLCGTVDLPEQFRRSSADFFSQDVIEWSFNTARKYFPDNKLVINEATHLWNSKFQYQRGWYYLQVERALSKGAPIDSLGMQYHIFMKQEEEQIKASKYYNPEYLFNVMDTYGKLGLAQQITEVTIPCYTDSAEDEQLQSDILEHLLRVWFANPLLDTVVYWNLIDGYAAFAPLGDMTHGENYFRGGLLHHDMSPKPAAQMIRRLFGEEWHTESEASADGTFRGFFGSYDVIIKAGGQTVHKSIHLSKDSDNVFDIKLD